MNPPTAIQCHKIHIDEDAVAGIVYGRLADWVPREVVTGLRLRYGFVAERPLVLALLASVTAAGGAWLAVHGLLEHSGRSTLQTAAVVAAAILAAPLVLRSAIERGYFLVVETARTSRKLGFGRKAAVADVARFVEEARAAGVEIRVEASLLR